VKRQNRWIVCYTERKEKRMSEHLPASSKGNSLLEPVRRHVIGTGRRKALFVRATDLYQSIRSSRFLPQLPEPPLLSGDDEHLWIGLAP